MAITFRLAVSYSTTYLFLNNELLSISDYMLEHTDGLPNTEGNAFLMLASLSLLIQSKVLFLFI